MSIKCNYHSSLHFVFQNVFCNNETRETNIRYFEWQRIDQQLVKRHSEKISNNVQLNSRSLYWLPWQFGCSISAIVTNDWMLSLLLLYFSYIIACRIISSSVTLISNLNSMLDNKKLHKTMCSNASNRANETKNKKSKKKISKMKCNHWENMIIFSPYSSYMSQNQSLCAYSCV